MRFALFLLLAGCSAEVAPTPAAPIVLGAPAPLARVQRPAPSAPSPLPALTRDTTALHQQADSYVHGPGTQPEIVDRLTVLVSESQRTMAMLEANKAAGGFRKGDVVAARAAANALARFINQKVYGK